jgi:2-polyprenyl-3-methyl-5-hydroxy-6-metoxy-1,4-benzoquinol methylase
VVSPTIHRLVPDELVQGDTTGRATLELHLARYEFAATHARGRVLDLACGVGYGSAHLAEHQVTSVVGVDLDPAAISYATTRYARDNVRYVNASGDEFRDSEGFDTIVSLETLEHLREPERLFEHLVGMLKSDGVLIASVPTTPSVDVNPYHLHDFTARSFRAMGARHQLREIDQLVQIQPFGVFDVMSRREPRMNDMRANLLSYYVTHPRAVVTRMLATLRYGFTNRYLTLAWRR